MVSSAQRSSGKGRRTVATYADHSSLSLATAALVVDEACKAVDDRGRFGMALTGGSTPAATYRFLATSPFREEMPWESTEVFWTDERCVGAEDPRSNERMARGALLDHVPVQSDRVHPMRCGAAGRARPGSHGADAEVDAQTCAQEYDVLLSSHFPAESDPAGSDAKRAYDGEGGALDLVLLGLGTDGHTASLFPGTKALQEKRTTAAVFVEGTANAATTAGDRDLWRVTMTASFINRASCVVFLVSGRAKADVVRGVLHGSADSTRLPARLIDPVGTLRWHLDEEAAALLDGVGEGD